VFLVVGLGNPGREHEGNRHNIGFMALDALGRSLAFPDFKPKFSGVWTRGELAGKPVALLKQIIAQASEPGQCEAAALHGSARLQQDEHAKGKGEQGEQEMRHDEVRVQVVGDGYRAQRRPPKGGDERAGR